MFKPGILVATLLATALVPGVPFAALRNPQVPVSGSALQSYLNALGESIDVQHAQLDGGLMQANVSAASTYSFQLELGPKNPALVVGLYDGTLANPPLVPIFPAEATSGWFATVSFRNTPTRVVVNLFDSNSAFIGSTKTLGGNRDAFGFCLAGPQGTFYTEDARNPGGSPQVLLFPGTGYNSGSIWLGLEDELPGPDANRDFIDTVMFFEPSIGLPVRTTTWGRLKDRFR